MLHSKSINTFFNRVVQYLPIKWWMCLKCFIELHQLLSLHFVNTYRKLYVLWTQKQGSFYYKTLSAIKEERKMASQYNVEMLENLPNKEWDQTLFHVVWIGVVFPPYQAALSYLLFRQYWPSSPADGELGFCGTVGGGWRLLCSSLSVTSVKIWEDRWQIATRLLVMLFCGSAVIEGKVAAIRRLEWSFIHFRKQR